jgi:hypothetical protein
MDYFVVAFAVLWSMLLVWLYLLYWLFRRLRCKHPTCYEAIGSPSLFWNNSMRNNWLFMKFLWSPSALELGDTAVVKVVRFLRVWYVSYLILFFGCIAGLFIFSP